MVVDQTGKSLLEPRVRVFFSIKSQARIQPEVIDLSQPGVRDKVASPEDPSKWKIADLDKMMATMEL